MKLKFFKTFCGIMAILILIVIAVLNSLNPRINEKCDVIKRVEFMEKCMQTEVRLEDKINLISECRFTSKNLYCNNK